MQRERKGVASHTWMEWDSKLSHLGWGPSSWKDPLNPELSTPQMAWLCCITLPWRWCKVSRTTLKVWVRGPNRLLKVLVASAHIISVGWIHEHVSLLRAAALQLTWWAAVDFILSFSGRRPEWVSPVGGELETSWTLTVYKHRVCYTWCMVFIWFFLPFLCSAHVCPVCCLCT